MSKPSCWIDGTVTRVEPIGEACRQSEFAAWYYRRGGCSSDGMEDSKADYGRETHVDGLFLCLGRGRIKGVKRKSQFDLLLMLMLCALLLRTVLQVERNSMLFIDGLFV
jgi:hypothetical protein